MTNSKEGSKVIDLDDLKILKNFKTEVPMNSGCISPLAFAGEKAKVHAIIAGGVPAIEAAGVKVYLFLYHKFTNLNSLVVSKSELSILCTKKKLVVSLVTSVQLTHSLSIPTVEDSSVEERKVSSDCSDSKRNTLRTLNKFYTSSRIVLSDLLRKFIYDCMFVQEDKRLSLLKRKNKNSI